MQLDFGFSTYETGVPFLLLKTNSVTIIRKFVLFHFDISPHTGELLPASQPMSPRASKLAPRFPAPSINTGRGLPTPSTIRNIHPRFSSSLSSTSHSSVSPSPLQIY